ncbi:methyltransferase [Streptomyces sp. NBC_00247]|uniref:methyltransferase n=1 Tax=Streptomyces sp. NBC_00247 TaxID=2975689 RepID=UPI002E2BBAFA|nr:methyltransferase [Streptomyces sp. NBC_00247]
MNTTLKRWHVGSPSDEVIPDGVVAFGSAEAAEAAVRVPRVVGFHQAMAEPLPRAEEVHIGLPTYRGKSFQPVLAWLAATRLAAPGARVVWQVDKQQGPDSVRRLLESLGWRIEQVKRGRQRLLSGIAPAEAELPEPRHFTARVAGAELTFAADYGVFSPGEVDAGTALLLEAALRCDPVESVADIGTGYGPLAIGLLRGGIARRALVTDVDCVALWLARHNARLNGTEIEARWTPDPGTVEATPLTVCNVPTHIDAEATRLLMDRLLERAKTGRLLAVVHASLESRYVAHFRRAGMDPSRFPGPAHVVLGAGA